MSWWDDGISTSSVSTTQATTGCHMLKIDGYSKTKLFGHNKPVMSCKFEAAGEAWPIIYYPNGSFSGAPDYISIYIEYLGGESINAKIHFSLVPHSDAWQEAPYGKTFVADFGRGMYSRTHQFPRFISKDELEKSEYLLDDCFAVRCDVEVVKVSAVADPAVDAHDLERLALPCSCEDGQCKRFHVARTAESSSSHQRHDDGGDVDRSPAGAADDGACSCNKDGGLSKHRTVDDVEEPPPQGRHGSVVPALRMRANLNMMQQMIQPARLRNRP